jgi:hypothetical protein
VSGTTRIWIQSIVFLIMALVVCVDAARLIGGQGHSINVWAVAMLLITGASIAQTRVRMRREKGL